MQGLVHDWKLAYVPPVFHGERLRPGVERKVSASWQVAIRVTGFPCSRSRTFRTVLLSRVGEMDQQFEEAMRRMIQQ